MIDFSPLNVAMGAAFGDLTGVYLPLGAQPIPLPGGIFTEITDHIFGEEGSPEANVTVATLGLQLSVLLPKAPRQGDGYRIGGTSYTVKDVVLDGLGWAYLDLVKRNPSQA